MILLKTQIEKSGMGFTLVELLVVIAILAVLTTAVVLILNPAQLIAQGRDSTRISDLAALNSSLALYLADASSPDLGTCTSTAGRATIGSGTSSTLPFVVATTTWAGSSATSTVGTSGWVDVDFTSISAGSPLSKLPMDPVNSAVYFYAYACNDTLKTYEINANMESTKYSNGGGGDVEINTKDGGDNNNWYEIGNDAWLNL